MFKKAGKKTSKVLAYLLALMIMVGYFPSTIIMTALAAEGDTVNYTITVKDGSNPIKGGVSVEITNKNNFDDIKTVTTDKETGSAQIELIDGQTYFFVASLDGYAHDADANGIMVNAANPNLTIVMTKLTEVNVSGVVTDDLGNPYTNADVTFTTESGFNKSVKTNGSGEYSLVCYKHIDNTDLTYDVEIKPNSIDEAKYAVITDEFDTSTASPVDFQFKLKKYPISLYKTGNGTVKFYSAKAPSTEITGDSLKSIVYGTDIIVEVEAAENYRLKEEDSFTVTGYDDAALDNEGKYTFTVKSNVDVSVVFEKYLFDLEIDDDFESTKGSIKFYKGDEEITSGKANKGDVITVKVEPDDAYLVKSMTINSTLYKNSSEETVTITEDLTVTANFEAKVFEVEFFVTGNGTIEFTDDNDTIAGVVEVLETPQGTKEGILYNGELVFDVIANSSAGYHIESIESSSDKMTITDDNNKTIGENDCIEKKVKISEITANGTVTVKFAINTYEVTLNNYAEDDGVVKVLVNGNEVNTNNPITVNHGDKIKLNLDPSKRNKKTVSRAEIGAYDCKAEQVFDVNWDWLDDKDGVLCTSDVVINITFSNINQCSGSWDDYVEIVKTNESQTTKIDNSGKYISNGNLIVQLKDDVKYDGKKIKNIDFLFENSNRYIGYETNPKEVASSNKIVELQIHNGTEYSVDLLGKPITFLIDKTDPVVSVENDMFITNTDSVTITATVTDEDTEANPSSGLDRVVYATEQLDDAAVKALPAESNLNVVNGKYSLTVNGEQAQDYYIYAIDVAGNVSEAKTVNVVIDKNAPVFPETSPISFSNGDPNTVCIANNTVASANSVKMTISANDVSSKIKEENGVETPVDVPCSGLSKVVITYTKNGAQETQELAFVDNATTVTYTFDNGEYKDVTLTVFDKAGNSKVYETKYNVVVNNGNLEIQNASFSVLNEENVLYEQNDNNQKVLWFKNTDIKFAFALNTIDSFGAIKPSSVEIKANGNVVDCTVNTSKYTSELKYTVDSETRTALREGLNEVAVTVITNTGVPVTKTFTFFIDKTPATIESFEFKTINDAPADKIINFLTFGIFSNTKVEVTVTAADTGAGVKTITLLAGDGSPLGDALEVDENNQVTFTIPESELTGNKIHFNKTISAIATDNVGNTTLTPVFPDTENSNAKSSGLMIETINPTIVVDYPSEPANQNEKTATAGEWYDGDIDFEIDIKDADSGIRSVEISINGELLVNKIYKDESGDIETYKDTFNVSTSQVEANTDGSYKLDVTVIDNAGNVEKATRTIYKDIADPYITKFSFDGTDHKESDEIKAVAEITDYGFYFTADTKVTVYAEDAVDADGKKVPTAGIKEIICYTQAVNQTEEVKVTDITVNADGTYSFTIKAGFKGQIFAEVNDNVGNGSGICSPDKAVVESQEQHNAATEAHVAFSVPETTVKTASGSPLYKATVPVSIVVTDTFAGIQKIEWSVTSAYDTTNNQTGSIELANVINTAKGGVYEGWKVDEKENNLVTVMSKTIDVANNSNDIVVKVTMTDRAGNTTTKEITFSIDKVAPMIDVTYDNNTPDADYDSFYKANRVATIVVTERNFNKDDVKIVIENTDAVIPALSEWVAVENKEDPDKTTYTATITYAADGDYTFDIDYNDRATNAAVYVVGEGVNNAPLTAEDFEKHEFTIDKTLPVVKVAYDNNKALNNNYYAAERTATITVTEHNFDKDRIVITGNATDNGKAVAFPAITGWTAKGDVYTTTINYKADAEYTFDIMITDKAGNIDDTYKEETFFVDKTVPEIEITGVANNSANNGKVAPVITYSDTNFTENGVTVTLTGVNKGGVDYSRGVTNVANGQTMSYENFKNVKDVDDIYTLTAKVVDKAGNETTKSITFSVNRFGSTYDLKTVKDYNNKYIQSMGDLVFTEINVNTLDLGTMRVKLTKNGTPSDLVMDKDFTVKLAGGGGRWCTYTYTLKSDLFKDDGKYTLSFYSVDAAGNINENIDETKEAEVSFAVDKTKPVILPIDLVEEERYEETVKTVTIEIKDNLLIKDVKIYLNDSEITYKAEGSNYVIEIPESIDRQTLKVVAVDAAGNEHETTVKDFLVTTNEFVQFINNPTAVIATIAGVVAVGGGGAAGFVFLGKKKRR